MTNREILKIFVRFLKENNAYTAYKENLGLRNYQSFIKENLDKRNHSIEIGPSRIAQSFMWQGTAQGDSYWNGLSLKWKTFYAKQITNK